MKHHNRPEMDTPEYKQWRFTVMSRHSFTCVLCSSKKNVIAHHIIRYADNVNLRLDPLNGIVLCANCHDNKVTGHEQEFETQLKKIVALSIVQRSNFNTKPKKILPKKRWRPPNCDLRY